MKILVYLEKSDVRGGIEIFAERHIARLRAEGHEVEMVSAIDKRQPTDGRQSAIDFSAFDEVVVHKCSDVATLESFPPEKTTYYVHDHEPICPRSYAYTPLKRNCTRPGGLWPCIFCAPLCRNWKSALNRVLSQERRKCAMARFRRLVVISEFMKGRLVANGIPAEKIVVEPPVLDILNAEARNRRASGARVCSEPSRAQASAERRGDGEDSASLRLCVEKIDLLFVGQLIRGKGVQLLLAAMARMKTPRTLDIVGTGNMEPKLRALAAQLGPRPLQRLPVESAGLDARGEVRRRAELLAGAVRARRGRGCRARTSRRRVRDRRAPRGVRRKGDARPARRHRRACKGIGRQLSRGIGSHAGHA